MSSVVELCARVWLYAAETVISVTHTFVRFTSG